MAAVLKAENFVEARIARLESDVTHIRSDLSDVKVDIRELKGALEELRERVGRLELKLAESTAILLHKIERTSLIDRVLMCVLICGAPFAERLVKML